ncbi:MAG: hypothetical protein WC767_00705 [Candidatus Paceibacterota bacterium]|jgi:phosphohistidine phosphatase SixA
MNKLIIVQHGHHDGSGDLTPQGEREIRELSEILKRQCVNGGMVSILSSHAFVARRSGRIMGDSLDALCRANPSLYSNPRSPLRYDDVLALIAETGSNADVVILVVHEDSMELPRLYGEQVLGVRGFPFTYPGPAQAWIIDHAEKTCRHSSQLPRSSQLLRS